MVGIYAMRLGEITKGVSSDKEEKRVKSWGIPVIRGCRNVEKSIRKVEKSLRCWWECKLIQPLWRTVWRFLKKLKIGASLVVQWLRIRLPMQGTWVRALVWEDPTCCGATGPVSHNY